jgi:hypothetical protein
MSVRPGGERLVMNHVEGRNLTLALTNPFLRPVFDAPASLPSAIAVPPVAIDADEVEDATADAIEVKVLWGGDVVHVAHVSRGGAFTIGDSGCDFALPAETVGAARLPLVSGRGGQLWVVLPNGATGSVRANGQPARTIDELIASGAAVASRELAGAYEIALDDGSSAKLELAEAHLALELTHVRAGKRVPVGLLSGMGSDSHAYTGLSAFLHGALVLSLAFFLPAMKGTDGENIDRDQVDALKPYLASIAEREREEEEAPANVDAKADQGGGTGAAAKNESGTMGTDAAKPRTDARWANKGAADNTDPHLAREHAIQEAETFGLIPMLLGSEHSPIAAWARPDASGNDPKSALGNMWGSNIDEAFGVGGLGLTGTGLGGGGDAEGIGLGDHGQLGHGLGDGTGPGIGNGPGGIGRGHGVLPSTYVPKGIKMREGVTDVGGGQIPAEVIQRIVRQNFGRFRLCYEDGLRGNPGLSGRVAVKFVIDRQGAVAAASDGGSDLPDQKAIACIVRGFQNLAFPEPKGGMVKVTYPIVFTPGE